MLNIKFDETLGAGQYFGSSEESDFLFNLLKTNRNIKFSKHIFVYHPVVEINQENYKNRSISYGLGKGAFFKKHLVDLNFYYLYLFILQMLILPILSILKSSFKCSRYLLRYKLNLFIYSWLGYIKYK